MTTYSALDEARHHLAQFAAAVQRLPTNSVHDTAPAMRLLGQLHSALDQIAPHIVDHDAADQRILNGTDG